MRIFSSNDESFLERLFFSDMAIKFVDLPAKQLEMIAKLQFKAKQQSYLLDWPMAEILIIQYSGEKVGQLILAKHKATLRIVDILLLPVFRNRGIATQVLKLLPSYNDNKFTRLELSVAKGNPAFELYKRHGFVIKSENEVQIEMVRLLT
jgi:ribosomal protein S18 acetylase RimI-like enzyme